MQATRVDIAHRSDVLIVFRTQGLDGGSTDGVQILQERKLSRLMFLNGPAQLITDRSSIDCRGVRRLLYVKRCGTMRFHPDIGVPSNRTVIVFQNFTRVPTHSRRGLASH